MNINGQEFILKFSLNNAYLVENVTLTFEQVGLSGLVKSFPSPAYFKFRVLNYNEGEHRLAGEIITYNAGYVSFPAIQQAVEEKLKLVRLVSFRDINTPSVFRMLSATKPTSLTPLHETLLYRPDTPAVIPPPGNFSATFHIPIKKVIFKNGEVIVSGKFDGYGKTVELSIKNKDIIEEYDAIKEYFGNVLNTKKIHVLARIEVSHNEVISQTASSLEIERINKQFIEVVKLEFLKNAKKNIKDNIDKSIFSVQEFLQTFGEEDFMAELFYKNENDLLEDLLKVSNTKHYRQLRFLSEKHCYRVMKLRIVSKPFSFIFLLEGALNYHLVWETLDTQEATYVWHIDKNFDILKKELEKVDGIITMIHTHGKNAYIQSAVDAYCRIFHDYLDSENGFSMWRKGLEETLT